MQHKSAGEGASEDRPTTERAERTSDKKTKDGNRGAQRKQVGGRGMQRW